MCATEAGGEELKDQERGQEAVGGRACLKPDEAVGGRACLKPDAREFTTTLARTSQDLFEIQIFVWSMYVAYVCTKYLLTHHGTYV